jgi:NADH dehydrogenase/putative oxidoreductase
LQPLVLLLMRVGAAALVVAPASATALGLRHLGLSGEPMLPSLSPGWQLVIALALGLGIAAGPAALALTATVPLNGITMSMDDRLTVLLVFLTIASAGAGPISVDRLIGWWARAFGMIATGSRQTCRTSSWSAAASAALRPCGACATRGAASP